MVFPRWSLRGAAGWGARPAPTPRCALSFNATALGTYHRRYANLIEADEARSVAQLELVRALMVRLPKNARGEAPWTHQSLDQVHPESGSSWLDGLASPDNTSAETEEARDLGLEAMVDQLPTAQAAALRLTVLEGLSLREAARQLGISPMTVQRAQKKALATLREQVSA